ncbi:DUF4870 domain-containing protein [Haladaptatus sp. GCM10025707]|uniref:DUF4870 domain-containing protein n=2 Tax=Haladaptatus TaxID=367188 RepID=UPI0036179D60
MATETTQPMDETQVTRESGTGLDENVAGALSYLLGFITGIIMYFVEPENEFVRFHAAQSIALSAVIVVISIVLSFIGTILTSLLFVGNGGSFALFSILSLLLGLVYLVFAVGSFALWIYMMVRAYQGKTPRIPIAAGLADRIA